MKHENREDSTKTSVDFTKLTDWKTFERFCTDVLEKEGFKIISEPYIDRSGADILVDETIRSHSGLSHTIQWFVQCKHYSGSGKNLTRQEIEKILYAFDARKEGGLLIITDTDISEEALHVLDNYSYKPNAKQFIKYWNRRELENRSLRHPDILRKYELVAGPISIPIYPFDNVNLIGKSILIISDTSAFSSQLFTSLNRSNVKVQLITLWQYFEPIRCNLLLSDILSDKFDLIIFFLGDSFGFPIPEQLVTKILDNTKSGEGGLILFPFFAWALHQGAYSSLSSLLPVKLVDNFLAEKLWFKSSRIFSAGDINWLNPEAFIENQFVEIDVKGEHTLLYGLEGKFGITHSFEFLDVKKDAKCILRDDLGTPFLILNESYSSPIVYINSCTHNCLTRTPILSPFEVSDMYQKIIVKSVMWCLGLIR